MQCWIWISFRIPARRISRNSLISSGNVRLNHKLASLHDLEICSICCPPVWTRAIVAHCEACMRSSISILSSAYTWRRCTQIDVSQKSHIPSLCMFFCCLFHLSYEALKLENVVYCVFYKEFGSWFICVVWLCMSSSFSLSLSLSLPLHTDTLVHTEEYRSELLLSALMKLVFIRRKVSMYAN